MSLLLVHDWWDDLNRPARLWDQNFGLGLRQDDLLSSLPSSFLRPAGYIRTWRSPGHQRGGASEVSVDKDRYQVTLDVQQFAPNEIAVKTVDNYIVVEGKHEEKQDEHGFISRQFTRRYALPKGIDAADVISSLSSDGVLTITAPKKPTLPVGERTIPIVQTGVPAMKSGSHQATAAEQIQSQSQTDADKPEN